MIVGGGAAGWITANTIAAECSAWDDPGLRVVLVESPNVPTIGVGEGTWPSMRMTLQRIGLSEDALVRDCDASFKQGTRFFGWSAGDSVDGYCHPFSLPVEYASLNPALHWLAQDGGASFAQTATPQALVIERGLAPKQASAPQYAFTVNYGYHLDALKFAALLRRHAVDRLGVRHIAGNVERIDSHPDGDIAAVVLDTGERVEGDLFVDCTGQRALLIGEHFGRGLTSVKDLLFNDAAITVQVPYADPNIPIASATCATAQSAGWIWDIGLQSRRGLGYVHSRVHTGEDSALAALKSYIARTSPGADPHSLTYRTILFQPGYRTEFWVGNCVAVGLSAGFVEPLEASALALVEQSAAIIGQQLPRDRQIMEVVAKRFNSKMHYHWQRILEFLKLHYAISARDDSDYWRDNRTSASCPEGLREKLTLWRQQPPWHDDAPRIDELFPSASYQYVLYGMGFKPRYIGAGKVCDDQTRKRAAEVFHNTRRKAQQMAQLLPPNRALLRSVAQRAIEQSGRPAT